MAIGRPARIISCKLMTAESTSSPTHTYACNKYTILGWHLLLITGRVHFRLAQHFTPPFHSCWKGLRMFVCCPAPGSPPLPPFIHSYCINTPYNTDCCQLWFSCGTSVARVMPNWHQVSVALECAIQLCCLAVILVCAVGTCVIVPWIS